MVGIRPTMLQGVAILRRIHQFVGIGTDKNRKKSKGLTKDIEDGGVFCS
jgi:hypothetical protein